MYFCKFFKSRRHTRGTATRGGPVGPIGLHLLADTLTTLYSLPIIPNPPVAVLLERPG